MNDVIKHGIRAQGRKELEMHLNGERLYASKAIKAKCYECECGYTDGVQKCNIPECPLFPHNPYSK